MLFIYESGTVLLTWTNDVDGYLRVCAQKGSGMHAKSLIKQFTDKSWSLSVSRVTVYFENRQRLNNRQKVGQIIHWMPQTATTFDGSIECDCFFEFDITSAHFTQLLKHTFKWENARGNLICVTPCIQRSCRCLQQLRVPELMCVYSGRSSAARVLSPRAGRSLVRRQSRGGCGRWARKDLCADCWRWLSYCLSCGRCWRRPSS